jgi:hypothetical protein
VHEREGGTDCEEEQVFARIEEHLHRQEHRSLLFPLLPLWRSRNDLDLLSSSRYSASVRVSTTGGEDAQRDPSGLTSLLSFPSLSFPLTSFPPTVFQALPYPLLTEPQRSHRPRHRSAIFSRYPPFRRRCRRLCISAASITTSCTVTTMRAVGRERASTSSGER